MRKGEQPCSAFMWSAANGRTMMGACSQSVWEATRTRLFAGSQGPPTTLSKSQYMAMACNLLVVEFEHYVSQYEMAYGNYFLN